MIFQPKMDAALCAQFINKTVSFRYHGVELRFDLSQSLFSSFDVDAGSKLLLKSIAQQVDMEEIRTVLDFGCGSGVLGIALGKRYPQCAVDFLDRNALALAVTERNLKQNHVTWRRLMHAAGLLGMPDERYDLLVSNVPAKAGNAVIRHFIRDFPAFVSREGVIAIVIVDTLADLAAAAIRDAGGTVMFQEAGKEHTVFHYRASASAAPEKDLSPYQRLSPSISHKKVSWKLGTVYGLPEFDSLSYATTLLLDLVASEHCGHRVLVWNPGQGHVPLFLFKKRSGKWIEFVLAGRDRLALEISRENLLAAGLPAERVRLDPRPSFHEVAGRFQTVIIFPDRDPGVPWREVLVKKAFSLLAPEGRAVLAAKSTFVHTLFEHTTNAVIIQDKRTAGFRAVLFRPG
ncbi:MAG TPA: methyltransferase domain-containing protein [Spirochaetia bacterium]|nr:methyltransferase domain-containing protein [Spirochaetia bacterium]